MTRTKPMFSQGEVVKVLSAISDPIPAKLAMVGENYTVSEVVEVEVRAYGIKSRHDDKMYYFLAGELTK